MMYRAVALCALVLLVVAPNYTDAQKSDLKSNGSTTATSGAAASAPAINAGKPLAAPEAAEGNNVVAPLQAQKVSAIPSTASSSAPGAPSKSAQPAAPQPAVVQGQQQPTAPVLQKEPAGASQTPPSTPAQVTAGQQTAPALAAPATKQDQQQQQQPALVQQAPLAVEPAPNAEALGLEIDELMSTNTPIITQSAAESTDAAIPASEFSQDVHTMVYVPPGDETHHPQRMPHSGKAAKKMYKYGGQYVLADDPSYTKPDSAALNKAVTYGDLEETMQAKQDRLQKYYVGEEAELTSELEQDSEAVSSFAWPTGRYSSKAAKYAATALKAQAGKPAAGGRAGVNARTKQLAQPAKQQGLAGLTAAWLKGKRSGEGIVQSATPQTTTGAVAAPAPYAQQGMLAAPDMEGLQYAQALEDGVFEDEQVFYQTIPSSEQYLRVGTKKRGKHVAQPAAGYIQGNGQYPGSHAAYHQDPSYYEYSRPDYIDPGYEYYDTEYDTAGPRGTREPKSVYNFRPKAGSVKQNVGLTTSSTANGGRAVDNLDGPVQIYYETLLTCANSDRNVGECRITGSILRKNESDAQVLITCDLNPDVSRVCGLKYLPGMQITAQGFVTVTLSSDKTTIERMSGSVLPITGAYTPTQKDTLLGDVLAVLHGVKGGSLNFDTQDTNTGIFSFFLVK